MDALTNDSLLYLLMNILWHGSLVGAMVIDIKPSLKVITVLRILNICRERSDKPPLNICYRNKSHDVVCDGFDETVQSRCPCPRDEYNSYTRGDNDTVTINYDTQFLF